MTLGHATHPHSLATLIHVLMVDAFVRLSVDLMELHLRPGFVAGNTLTEMDTREI